MVVCMKIAALLAVAALLSACEMTPADGGIPVTSAMSGAQADTPQLRGQRFAQNRCADCHAVERLQTSPVPNAPSFEAVANASGVTRESLSQWLNTSHDYPREMYFEIPVERIDDLVAYLLTLRSEDYEPTIGRAPTPATGGSLHGETAAVR